MRAVMSAASKFQEGDEVRYVGHKVLRTSGNINKSEMAAFLGKIGVVKECILIGNESEHYEVSFSTLDTKTGNARKKLATVSGEELRPPLPIQDPPEEVEKRHSSSSSGYADVEEGKGSGDSVEEATETERPVDREEDHLIISTHPGSQATPQSTSSALHYSSLEMFQIKEDASKWLDETTNTPQSLQVQDEDGNTVLHRVLLRGDALNLILGRLKESQRLHEARPGLFNSSGYNCLHLAVLHSDTQNVSWVLEMDGGLIHQTDATTDSTPLHLAAQLGKRDTVSLLIQKGADVNAKDCNGQTPLHKAVTGFQDLPQRFRNMRDIYARLKEKVETLGVVISKGADLGAKEKWEENTPLHVAMKEINGDLRHIFHTHASTIIDIQTKKDWNLATLEVDVYKKLRGCPVLVPALFLVSQGADLRARNSEGKTPEEYLDKSGLHYCFLTFRDLHVPRIPEFKGEMCMCGEKAELFSLTCGHYVSCIHCHILHPYTFCPHWIDGRLCGELLIDTMRHKSGKIVNAEEELRVLKEERGVLMERLEALKKVRTCSLCREKSVNFFLSCGHFFCYDCGSHAKMPDRCSLEGCRQKIIDRNIAYIPNFMPTD